MLSIFITIVHLLSADLCQAGEIKLIRPDNNCSNRDRQPVLALLSRAVRSEHNPLTELAFRCLGGNQMASYTVVCCVISAKKGHKARDGVREYGWGTVI